MMVGVTGSLHDEVASAIGRQVEQMILQAKKDSEARVKHELSHVRHEMEAMQQQINALQRQPGQPGLPVASQPVDRTSLSSALQAQEQRWGAEMKSMKQDLHRTILAHNHNSDLLKDHKNALDEVRGKIESQPRANQISVEQLSKVDRMLPQGQAKHRTLDALYERLDSLESRISATLASGYPTAAMGVGSLGAPQVVAAPAAKASGNNSLRSEAPVFVPSGPPAAATVDPTMQSKTVSTGENDKGAGGDKEKSGSAAQDDAADKGDSGNHTKA